jgi:hypothetical protein
MKNSKILYLAIPILVILLGLVIYQYGYLRIQENLSAIKEEESAKIKILQKYMSIIAEGPELQKKLLALNEQRKNETTKLIQGDTFSLAAASLQEIVKGIITSRNGVISSERVGKEEELAAPAPPGQPKEEPKGNKASGPKKEKKEDKKRFKIINVSFDFTAPDTGALRDIIFFIETKTPSLVIKELDCRVRNFQQPRDLMVRLDVSALYGGK